MKNILVDEERELNVRSNMIYNMTKEVVENDTDANKRLFFWLCHETWMLKKFPKFLTSKKAYEMFYAMYKQDIRDFGWADSKVEKVFTQFINNRIQKGKVNLINAPINY